MDLDWFALKFAKIMRQQMLSPEVVAESRIEFHRPFLERLDHIENSSIELFDCHRQQYAFMTPSFKYLIGYDSDAALQTGPEFFLNHLHPEDLPQILETVVETFQFLNAQSPQDRLDYKLIFDYRIRNGDDAYIRMLKQIVVLELATNGGIWLVLITNDRSPDKDLTRPMQRKLINMKTDKNYLFAPDSDETCPLSRREIEVLGLVAQGWVSKEIADRLFISVNTVNNHRRHILKKLKVDNSHQAVSWAHQHGLI